MIAMPASCHRKACTSTSHHGGITSSSCREGEDDHPEQRGPSIEHRQFAVVIEAEVRIRQGTSGTGTLRRGQAATPATGTEPTDIRDRRVELPGSVPADLAR